ncbi:MAG: LuxR C-terminal-related transcriptional regulator [Rubrivivax sp.]
MDPHQSVPTDVYSSAFLSRGQSADLYRYVGMVSLVQRGLVFFEAVANSTDLAALASNVNAFAADFGCTGGCVLARRKAGPMSEWRVNLVGHFADPAVTILQSPSFRGSDPLWRHCESSTLPRAWARTDYEAAGELQHWQLLAGGNVRSGLVAPAPWERGLFVLRIDSPLDEPFVGQMAHEVLARVRLFTTYAEAAARRLELYPEDDLAVAALAPRELEVLRWAADGKSEKEIGRALGLSYHTVSKYLDTAQARLGCRTRIEAVVRVYRAGLL